MHSTATLTHSFNTEQLNLPTTLQDFKTSLQKVSKTVSTADIDKYKLWMEEFGST